MSKGGQLVKLNFFKYLAFLMSEKAIPRSYVNKKFHSLAGIWLVLFLLEHLITNSQAALYIGDWGQGFVKAVNMIHDLPYLQAIEILFLGFPILLHAGLGIKYLFTAKFNSFGSKLHEPKLKYPRNRAYSWQRITSWVLLVGLLLHIIQMRFMDYPIAVNGGIGHDYYMVRLDMDPSLYPVAARLNAHLYTPSQIQKEKSLLLNHRQAAMEDGISTDATKAAHVAMMQQLVIDYVDTLAKKPLKENQLIAVSPSFGVASLLTVRQTFKSPTMIILYTLFVIAACYHAFNGLWTAMISWGVTLTARSQQLMRQLTIVLTLLLTLLGLSAIWLTYWVNLR